MRRSARGPRTERPTSPCREPPAACGLWQSTHSECRGGFSRLSSGSWTSVAATGWTLGLLNSAAMLLPATFPLWQGRQLPRRRRRRQALGRSCAVRPVAVLAGVVGHGEPGGVRPGVRRQPVPGGRGKAMDGGAPQSRSGSWQVVHRAAARLTAPGTSRTGCRAGRGRKCTAASRPGPAGRARSAAPGLTSCCRAGPGCTGRKPGGRRTGRCPGSRPPREKPVPPEKRISSVRLRTIPRATVPSWQLRHSLEAPVGWPGWANAVVLE